AFNGTYPNTSALLTLLAGTKTTNLRIDGGATWGIDVVNTNNSIRTSGRSIFGDNVGVDDATFQIGTGSVSITGGAGRTDNLFIVNGLADATVASLAANTVWDSRINGDQLVTGIQKIGGSIWLDGNSAIHQIVTDAPINLGTKNANTTALITNNLQRLFIDGAGNTTITGNLSLTGIVAPPLPAPLIHVLYLNPSNQINQTPTTADIVTGSGTLNTIPMWTPDNFKIGNSIMTQTSNTGISVTPGVATTDNVLVVNGVADATVANVAADAVWDERLNGDLLVTGREKIGGSIWLDGTSATHQIVTDAPVNIGTKNGNTVALITNNSQRFSIDNSGNTTIAGGNTTINGGGTLTLNVGNTAINEGSGQFSVNATPSNTAQYAMTVSTTGHAGMAVYCKEESGSGLSSTTHFADFYDGTSGGNWRGSIQGQSYSEWFADPINAANLAIDIAKGVAAVAEAAVGVADALELINATDAVGWAAQVATLVADQTQYGITTGIQTTTGLGVSYQSSSGDYAEFLKRENPEEHLYPGDIVGLKNGLISRNTQDAQAVFSISLAPIVLGNVPPRGEEALYNKVGFLGQVPVKVNGVVNAGDFILASGNNDGIGVAVAADKITAEQFTMVIGRAWTSSTLEGVKYIKVAVGLNAKAMSEIMSREQAEIDALQKQVNELQKQNGEVATMKARLERLEQYLSQPQKPSREIIYKAN
ncbi:MAG: bZIP transcription factor, partial [Bacteroidota bacterium]|nr:bZIP transcription factor [Bacteroidota bacterium]